MREMLRGLTVRGRAVAASGLVLLVAAIGLGQRDLVAAALLALLLPLVSGLLLVRTRYRLTCARGVGRTRIERGSATTGLARLQNTATFPTGLVVAVDTVPELLGHAHPVALDQLPPGGSRDLRTELAGTARGRYDIGPVQVTLRDSFGMCAVTRSFTETDTLVVVPRTVPLPGAALAGLWGGRGDSESRAIAHSGDDDVIPRAYRVGDELRRVHWPATARSGELMVRREEQPWRTSATVLLDRRASSHRGRFPDSSFEAAVSVAASAALALARQGLAVRVVDTDGLMLAAGADADAEASLLDALALVEQVERGAPLVDSATLRRAISDGTLLAAVCRLDAADTAVLGGLRRAGGLAAALVIDPLLWDTDGALRPGEATAAALRGHGWRAAAVTSQVRPAGDAELDAGLHAAWESLAQAARTTVRGAR